MNSITNQDEAKILAVVQGQRSILFDQLLAALPELTWNQVFAIVDEMNRRGVISLRRRGIEYELHARSSLVRLPVPVGDFALSTTA